MNAYKIPNEYFINFFHFLGRKRKKSKTSNYVISCDPTGKE